MKKLILFLFLFLLTGMVRAQKTYGIFVDGSYSPGKNKQSHMDRLIDNRLAEADKQMARLSPKSKRQKVESKEAFLAALKKIKCKCGDEINIVMMGHGKKGKFYFTKASGSKRIITAVELRKALGAAATECCCKINVVIMSCHSGSFQKELLKESHVNSVYTSSLASQITHVSAYMKNMTTFVDGGGWMKGFNHDLSKVGSAANMAEAYEKAAESAWERTPMEYVRTDTPTGWRRGDHKVLVHLSGRPSKYKNKWRVKVTYYQPHWMRGKEKYIYFTSKPPKTYHRCKWISGKATFDTPDKDVVFTNPTTITEAPKETILAHVMNVYRNGLKVHTVRPKWQFCKPQYLYTNNKNKKLARCMWINPTVDLTDPLKKMHTSDLVNPVKPTFRMRFHVEKYYKETGFLKGRPMNTNGKSVAHWLGKYIRLYVPKAERDSLEKRRKSLKKGSINRYIKKCTNIYLDITMLDERPSKRRKYIQGTATNIHLIYRQLNKGFSYDIAAHDAFEPSRTIVGTVVPEVTLTNVGSDSMDFAVEVAIGEKGSQNAINAWLAGGNMNTGLWTDTQKMENLGPAQTVDVRFGHFRFTPGKDYIMAFTVRSDKDEVSRNDTTSITFRFEKRKPISIPEGVVITAAGTGKTTGDVVTLSVDNPLDEAVVLDLGPYVIPPARGFQGYVIPEPFTVIVPPGERVTVPLEGYCISIHHPPVPDGEPAPGIGTWIDPTGMPPILLDGENPPLGAAAYQPVSRKKKPEGMTPSIPGTTEDFPWTIDIGEYPDVAAPYIFNATEAISQAYDELYDDGLISTPFNADFFKEKEAVVQHTLWEYTTALEGGSYTFEDFKKNSIKEAETILKKPLDQAPLPVQQEITEGIGSFWDSFEAVGVHAKVLKKD